jgi:hypothetical protein
LIVTPLINCLKSVNNNRVERALFEPQFLHRKNGRAATAAVIVKLFHGLPQVDLLEVPFRVKRGLGKQIFLIAAGRPRPT